MRAVLAAAVAAIAVLASAAPVLADTVTGSTSSSSTTGTTTSGDVGATAARLTATSTSTTGTSTTLPSTTSTPVTSTPTTMPPPHQPVAVPASRRVIVYYQKHYQDDRTRTGYISPLPLLTQNTGVDVVNLAAIHMNKDVLNLNDDLPSDPMYDRMWAELHQMQDDGIAVVGMIGGAVNDTWPNLQTDFETQYARLRDFVRTYRLDGIDLDIELDQAQEDQGLTIDIDTVVRVVDRLRTDFGPDFLITSSPVMDEFGPGDPDDPDSDPSPDGIYGVDFNELYRERGDQIDWFNMQAYCGHGLPTPEFYDAVVDYQLEKGAQIPPEKLVIAALTNPDNCEKANGWVPIPELTAGLVDLVARYPTFGGVAGWEYFNSLPDGPVRPWEWAAVMRVALDTEPTPTPTTTTPTPTTTPTTDSTTSPPVTPTTIAPITGDPFTDAPFVPVDVTPTWTVAPAPAVVPVVSDPASTGQRTLAATGVDLLPVTTVGALSILLGVGALLLRRRSNRSH